MKGVSSKDLARITPRSLEAYLARRDEWGKSAAMANGAGVFYELEDGGKAVVVLRSTEYGDYAVRMAENVSVLAEYEDREPRQVLQDLLASYEDVIRVRVDVPSTPSLNSGVTLLNQSRKLLLAAARAAESPEPIYTAKPRKELQNYLASVRFGHTEPGSLVLPIYSPVPTGLPVDDAGRTDGPLAQRVVRTLVYALAATRSQVSEPAPQGHSVELGHAVFKGMSANLCYALSELVGLSGGVSLSVNWALAYTAPEANYVVRFIESDRAALDESSRKLEHYERKDEIVGQVFFLVRDPDGSGRRAKVKAHVSGARTTVQVNQLSASEYRRLLDAHREYNKVSLIGTLQRRGGIWELVPPREVRVLEDD